MLLDVLLHIAPPDRMAVAIAILLGFIGAALLLLDYSHRPGSILHNLWVAFGLLAVSLALSVIANSILVHSPPSSIPELHPVVGGFWMNDIARETLHRLNGDLDQLMSYSGGWHKCLI